MFTVPKKKAPMVVKDPVLLGPVTLAKLCQLSKKHPDSEENRTVEGVGA